MRSPLVSRSRSSRQRPGQPSTKSSASRVHQQQEILRRCNVCGARAVYVLESRTATAGAPEVHKRRRCQCRNCGARSTTREISDELFQTWLAHSKALAKAMDVFQGNQIADKTSCRDCFYRNGSSCSLGLPEFMTEEAQDCTNFKAAT